jgi:hypothetical protein
VKAKLSALAALVLLLGSLAAVPASAAPTANSGATDPGLCAVSTNADGTISVTCGPGQSWPNDTSIGQCFDKKLQADGVTVVVTCEPVGVAPPTPVPPTPVPSSTPCGVTVNADRTISVMCGPGQSWPNDTSIGQCFDKKLLDDGVTVVVTCTQAADVVAPPPPAPTKVVPKPSRVAQTAAQKLAAKKAAAKKLAAKKAAAKKLAAKKLAAKKLAAKKLAAKKAAATR